MWVSVSFALYSTLEVSWDDLHPIVCSMITDLSSEIMGINGEECGHRPVFCFELLGHVGFKLSSAEVKIAIVSIWDNPPRSQMYGKNSEYGISPYFGIYASRRHTVHYTSMTYLFDT